MQILEILGFRSRQQGSPPAWFLQYKAAAHQKDVAIVAAFQAQQEHIMSLQSDLQSAIASEKNSTLAARMALAALKQQLTDLEGKIGAGAMIDPVVIQGEINELLADAQANAASIPADASVTPPGTELPPLTTSDPNAPVLPPVPTAPPAPGSDAPPVAGQPAPAVSQGDPTTVPGPAATGSDAPPAPTGVVPGQPAADSVPGGVSADAPVPATPAPADGSAPAAMPSAPAAPEAPVVTTDGPKTTTVDAPAGTTTVVDASAGTTTVIDHETGDAIASHDASGADVKPDPATVDAAVKATADAGVVIPQS